MVTGGKKLSGAKGFGCNRGGYKAVTAVTGTSLLHEAQLVRHDPPG
jgi:hypothetical protein